MTRRITVQPLTEESFRKYGTRVRIRPDKEPLADNADLFGAPFRVVVGKKTLDDGAVDVRDRTSGDEARIASLELAKWVVAR